MTMTFFKNNFWKIINSIFLIAIIAFLIRKNDFDNKNNHQNFNIAYIDNIKIFSNFNMTKDLSKINEKKYASKIKAFDSLVVKIKTMENYLKKQRHISKKEKLNYAKIQKIVIEKDKELKRIQENVKNEINVKVWKRLNEYIVMFGKKKKLNLILGAQGNGNIMYGNSKINITDSFIKFANNKYEGN